FCIALKRRARASALSLFGPSSAGRSPPRAWLPRIGSAARSRLLGRSALIFVSPSNAGRDASASLGSLATARRRSRAYSGCALRGLGLAAQLFVIPAHAGIWSR